MEVDRQMTLFRHYDDWKHQHAGLIFSGNYNNHRVVYSFTAYCREHGIEVTEDEVIHFGDHYHRLLSLHIRSQLIEMQTEVVIPRASEMTAELGGIVIKR